MKLYIYQIINKLDQKRYIGQTIDFKRRIADHLGNLRRKEHPNIKLQNAWNKYGEENFIITHEIFEVENQIEADNLEKTYIRDYDSYNNGYNLTIGGRGGYTSTKPTKINFENYCFAYFGNLKYDGMLNQTARYIGCDSSTISHLVNKKYFLEFNDKAEKLSDKEKEEYLQKFIEVFNLNNKTPPKNPKNKILNDDLVLDILCVASSYSRGIQTAIQNKFNLSKGLVFHVMKYKEYPSIREIFKNMSKEERFTRGQQKFQEWNLQENYKTILKIQYTDLFDKFKTE